MRTELGRRLQFGEAPYVIDILLDDRRNHVAIACAQSRKTVTYLTKTLWTLTCKAPELPGFIPTAIYTFPTKTDVDEFSAARARPMIEGSPFLREELGDLDRQAVKQGRSGWTIYFRGTWTERGAISVPAGMLIHDEVDRSKPGTLQMYSDRTRASSSPHRFVFSTPTVPKFGVSAEWENSDQNEWAWECADCGEEQVFAPMDGTSHWSKHLDIETREFRCAHCGVPVDREWVRDGRWLPFAPENEHTAGYHITGIMPPQASAERLCAELDRAVFPELWVNGHIGLPAVSGEMALTADMIQFGDWPNAAKHEGPCYAGLDQGKKLDLVVGDGQGRIISVQRCDDWSQVTQAMRLFNVRLLVADSQPDPRPLQELVRQFPGRVLLADYSLRTVDRDPYERVKGEPRIRLHRTAMLDWARDRIVMGQDGGDVWPALSPQLEGDLKAQLSSMQRTVQPDAQGNPTAQWLETGPDHLRHAHVYYVVASILFGGPPVDIAKLRGEQVAQRAINAATGEEQTIRPTRWTPEHDTVGNPTQDRAARDATLRQRFPFLFSDDDKNGLNK